MTRSASSLLKSSRYTMVSLRAHGLDGHRKTVETLHEALLKAAWAKPAQALEAAIVKRRATVSRPPVCYDSTTSCPS